MDAEQESARILRVKERRRYTEDCLQDEEIEGKRMFSVEEKLTSDRFTSCFVKEMKGEDFNFKYLQEHGFEGPIVFKDKAGLGMRMPSSSFSVNDVRQCVGSRRILDVMDVTTQKDIEMTMKDWCRYFENTSREKLLNVISLEFSHTRLENYVESPTVVRQVDWVDWVWPRHLKESQTEGTNAIEDMKYPKVQKYCLMSVKGCYTDFHIDFGGTSVWYHILQGQKVFWLIPPTERNLYLYEQWVLSGKQGDVFFGDTVEKCARVHLYSGFTFFIPTGWIHAVFTPEDTLVFGGNFLHCFGIEKQLRIAEIEDATHVPVKFRYPFYTEILWYVLNRYVFCLMGKNHLKCVEEGEAQNPSESPPKEDPSLVKIEGIAQNRKSPLPVLPIADAHANQTSFLNVLSQPTSPQSPKDLQLKIFDQGKILNSINGRRTPTVVLDVLPSNYRPRSPVKVANGTICNAVPMLDVTKSSQTNSMNGNFSHLSANKSHVHLTRLELNGLKAILQWLLHLPPNKKNHPDMLKDPDALLEDVKILLQEHWSDDPVVAITGKPVLFWTDSPKKPKPKPRPTPQSGSKGSKSGSSKEGGKSGSGSNSARRRRTRCKKCEACLRADCGECHFCKDMKKFGGPGRMKQSCISRQCMAPVLPHTACCMICGRDGWDKVNNPQDHENSSLMECSQCWEIVHPACLREHFPDLSTEGISNDDLPNSWECPKCCRDGKPDQIKPRHIKGTRQKTGDGGRPSFPTPDVGLLLDNVTPADARLLPEEQNLAVKPPVINEVKYPAVLQEVQTEAGGNLDYGQCAKKLRLDDVVVKLEPSDEIDKLSAEIISAVMPASGDDTAKPVPGPQRMTQKRSSPVMTDENENREDISSGGARSPNKELLQDQAKRKRGELRVHSSLPSHVRSCARYSVAKAPTKSEHPKIIAHKHGLKTSSLLAMRKNGLELRTRSSCVPLGVTTRRHGETARERLFRSLKGLKKNSELMRHGILRIKSRTGVETSILKKGLPIGTKDLPKCEVKVEPIDQLESMPRKEKGSFSSDGDSRGARRTLATDKGARSSKNAGDRSFPPNSTRFSVRLRERAQLKRPKYVVRPTPLPEIVDDRDKVLKNGKENLALVKEAVFPVFRRLSTHDLFTCQLVCKVWNRWSTDPCLWSRMDLSRRKLNPYILMGIVRRQPVTLNLGWTNISRRQLSWLVSRLPQLKDLVLSGCTAMSIAALCTCGCPLLRSLDLSWVEGLNDSVVRTLLAPPPDSRPGFVETKTRLRQLVEVRISGADVSDVSLRLLAHHLPLLSRLDLSHCHKVTDMGIAVLGAAKSSRLAALDVSSCANITDTSLEALRRCTSLLSLDMRECPQVTEAACQKFVAQNRQYLALREGRLIERHY